MPIEWPVIFGAGGFAGGIYIGLWQARKGMVSQDACENCKKLTSTMLEDGNRQFGEIKAEQASQRVMLTGIARDVNQLVGFHKREGGNG